MPETHHQQKCCFDCFDITMKKFTVNCELLKKKKCCGGEEEDEKKYFCVIYKRFGLYRE
jgi:hypothetical protein